jgi:hypothetical protein
MRVNGSQEVVRRIGARQFLDAFDLFVEEADRLHQQFGVGLRCLGI